MVILKVFSKNIKSQYKTTLCSKATLFILIINIITIILPYIFAYKSSGFWLKRDTFHEYPDIRFRNEYLFIAITDNLTAPIICNNFPYFQDYSDYDLCHVIKAKEIDHNNDGKMDDLEFYLEVNMRTQFNVITIFLLLPLDYKLHEDCPLQMQSAAIYQYNVPIRTTDLEVEADLMLTQKHPITCFSRRINLYSNHSIITNPYNQESYMMKSILTEYNKRNVSTHLENLYAIYTPGLSSNFVLNMKIHYKEHMISYKPGFWQIMKWAWIQYFALYIVVSWTMTKVKEYVFENKLVLFYETTNVKKHI